MTQVMNRSLIEFTPEFRKRHMSRIEAVLGFACPSIEALYKFYRRLTGDFTRADRIKVACYCEPPMYFLNRGCMISHPYGITLSADEIGADCRIGQNVTIGRSGRTTGTGERARDKPKLGNLVSCYPGAVISGDVRIGNNVIISANTFVDKDVPDNSIVYGRNIVKPLQEHHRRYLKEQLWHCVYVYKLVPGLTYAYPGKLFIDVDYVSQRMALLDG